VRPAKTQKRWLLSCISSLYYVDFVRHDLAGMEFESKQLMGKPGWEDSMLYFEADDIPIYKQAKAEYAKLR
jgi:hypothetical protein